MKAVLRFQDQQIRILQVPTSIDERGDLHVLKVLTLWIPGRGQVRLEFQKLQKWGGQEVSEYREVAAKEAS